MWESEEDRQCYVAEQCTSTGSLLAPRVREGNTDGGLEILSPKAQARVKGSLSCKSSDSAFPTGI